MEQELAGKVAIVTGAGRMRSIGRPIAKRLAQAGAAIVITGTGRPPERYPDDEKAAGWRDIESVADEIRGAAAAVWRWFPTSPIRARSRPWSIARSPSSAVSTSSSTTPAPPAARTACRRSS